MSTAAAPVSPVRAVISAANVSVVDKRCPEVSEMVCGGEGRCDDHIDPTGEETPETGTPLTRSLSPSSDGGTSAADRSEPAASRRQNRRKKTRPSAGSMIGGMAPEAQSTGAPTSALEARAASLQQDAARQDAETEASAAKKKLGGNSKSSRRPPAARHAPATVGPPGCYHAFPGPMGGLPPVHFGIGAFCMPFLGGTPMPGATCTVSDRQILDVLAAKPEIHKRLLETARRLPEILLGSADSAVANSAELYGSLALLTESPRGRKDRSPCYVNGQSDVDFVVEMKKDVAPYAMVERLLEKDTWKLVGTVQVHKFSSTQFTLLGSFDEQKDPEFKKVYLDLTCIESPVQFNRFKKRQEAFRKAFLDVRKSIEENFAEQGTLAFDAYIHLLKAFAAKVPRNAISVYQATCIGLFTLQIGHFRLRQSLSLALCFFEGFLRFCYQFYLDTDTPVVLGDTALGYRRQAIDLSCGRLLPRISTSWRSELYFRNLEERQLSTRPDEWMNVTHSLDPQQVSKEALGLLKRAFVCDDPAGKGLSSLEAAWGDAST
ncbi:unnamed protein product [Symbiodinium sp. CCMP2592]|nr:unnamed protein product [Symbiodinium sp. CCMP2592]